MVIIVVMYVIDVIESGKSWREAAASSDNNGVSCHACTRAEIHGDKCLVALPLSAAWPFGGTGCTSQAVLWCREARPGLMMES